MTSAPYYQEDLAWVHDQGYRQLAERAAPGIVALLRQAGLGRGASVLEVGCGSGLLARAMVEAGFEVLGMDASPAMIALAHQHAPDARFEVRRLPTRRDPGASGGLPVVDAVVSTGHVLNYLDAEDITAGLRELAAAIRPGGVLALDLMTERFAGRHERCGGHARVEEEWALFTRDSRPGPLLLERQITVFRRVGDHWRRQDEIHRNVTFEPAQARSLLEKCGISTEERASFGDEPPLDGLVVLVGLRR